MLKIGEFSKLAHITVKALRFYEKAGILKPASVDEWTGYRFYDTSQLLIAARIRSYRQLGLSVEEIRRLFSGADVSAVLSAKARELSEERRSIDIRLSVINSILEENNMDYQVSEKLIAEQTVYFSETVLEKYSDIMTWIPAVGAECMALNPTIKCTDPPYEFCEYLDAEHKENNIRIRHCEAVTSAGKENEHIRFCRLPSTRVLCIYHKGAYESIGDAYAFIMKYAETNGYKVTGAARECYIDGIWNKDDPADWLTEIQLPIE